MVDLDPTHYVPRVVVRGPERRQQLVEATVRVLLRDGLAGVTHRSVSDESGLPMSATTYYFVSLDALITTTLQALSEAFVAESFPIAAGTGNDPLDEIADTFYSLLTERRRGAFLLVYELHLASARRPELRGHTLVLWEHQMRQFQAYLGVSRPTAAAVGALLDGYAFANLSVGAVPDPADLRAALEQIVRTVPAVR